MALADQYEKTSPEEFEKSDKYSMVVYTTDWGKKWYMDHKKKLHLTGLKFNGSFELERANGDKMEIMWGDIDDDIIKKLVSELLPKLNVDDFIELFEDEENDIDRDEMARRAGNFLRKVRELG